MLLLDLINPEILKESHSGNALITASKVANATAFAGNALKKHGRNPLQ
jgi:hypothetical protein